MAGTWQGARNIALRETDSGPTVKSLHPPGEPNSTQFHNYLSKSHQVTWTTQYVLSLMGMESFSLHP